MFVREVRVGGFGEAGLDREAGRWGCQPRAFGALVLGHDCARGHPSAPLPGSGLVVAVVTACSRLGIRSRLAEIPATDHPFTAPEVRPEITHLRKMSTKTAMGTTATTLAAKMVPYGTWKFPPNSAMPTGMVR